MIRHDIKQAKKETVIVERFQLSPAINQFSHEELRRQLGITLIEAEREANRNGQLDTRFSGGNN